MAVTTSSEQSSFENPPVPAGSLTVEEVISYTDPPTGPGIGVATRSEASQLIDTSVAAAIQKQVVNKVWDTNKSGGAGWVLWTSDDPDTNGISYPPGNGAFGIDTSAFRIQSVVYTEPE